MRKGKLTPQLFDRTKNLLDAGLKTKMVSDVIGLHITTIGVIRRCDTIDDYRTFTKRKLKKRQEANDVKVSTLPIPDTSVVSIDTSGANSVLNTSPTGTEHVKEFTTGGPGEIHIGGTAFWTYPHAAKVFDVSYSAISKMVADSGVIAKKIGRRNFICVNSLRDYMTRPDSSEPLQF